MAEQPVIDTQSVSPRETSSVSGMESGTVTQLLRQIESGDELAKERLFSAVEQELRVVAGGLMRAEMAGHTLQPTALVNEAAMRLLGEDALGKLRGRAHFFGTMANAMRRILVDHARKRKALRRGSGVKPVPLDDAVDLVQRSRGIDLLALDEALEQLKMLSARQCDVVIRRFFGGFENQEIADQLQVSLSTVEKDWRIARAWLKKELAVQQ